MVQAEAFASPGQKWLDERKLTESPFVFHLLRISATSNTPSEVQRASRCAFCSLRGSLEAYRTCKGTFKSTKEESLREDHVKDDRYKAALRARCISFSSQQQHFWTQSPDFGLWQERQTTQGRVSEAPRDCADHGRGMPTSLDTSTTDRTLELQLRNQGFLLNEPGRW